MNTRRTQAKNATTHPGAIVLAAQGKWQTNTEKQADNNRVVAEKAMAEKFEQERVITIAKLVMQLREKEQNAATLAISRHGRARSVIISVSATKQELTDFIGNKRQTKSEEQPKVTAATGIMGKKLRRGKASLKVKISEASKTISNLDDANGSASGASEANVSQYLPKAFVSGTIKGWATRIHETTTLVPRLSRSTKALDNMDMSTSVSTMLNSQPSQATTNSTKIEGSQIPPWYDNYECTPPPTQPHQVPSGVMKRKIEEVPDSLSYLNDEEMMAELGMEIDTDVTHEVRTTVSESLSFFLCTSVGVVHVDHDTQPIPKKAKIESEDTLIGTKTGMANKSHSDYKNSNLPVPADQRWTNIFIDTVILWAGGQSSIWSIPDETLATAIQRIFSVVYPDIQYKVTIQGAVFGVVSQCLLEWHSGFGSTALVMVIHYFWEMIKSNAESELANTFRDILPSMLVREIATHLISLPHFPFTHEDCDNPNPTCNFRSDFIITLIANAHLSKTLCAVDVTSLGTAMLQKGYGMESVIALASTALECAFTLVRDGLINIQDAVKEMAEKKGEITLPKTLNKVTRNMSKGTSLFSHNNWGSETQSYTTTLVKKGPENTADIIESVYALLSHAPAHSTTGSHDANIPDPHTLLW
ncbi:hypothetical protein JVU11DRAFT_10991 [Chiua virens]|nr:hypothetical protein JVU11DRAFT_10991 [Chiua virens]